VWLARISFGPLLLAANRSSLSNRSRVIHVDSAKTAYFRPLSDRDAQLTRQLDQAFSARWHRVVKERFCTRFDTYTGGSPDEKPFDLEECKKAGKAPSMDELVEAFASWLVADYTMKEHGGADMDGAPAQV